MPCSPGRGTRRSGSVELVSQRPAGPAPTCTAHEDDQAEARTVAAAVRARLTVAGRPRASRCSSAPTAQSEALEAALAEQDIPTSCGEGSDSSSVVRCARPSCCSAAPLAATTVRCRCPSSCGTSSSEQGGRTGPHHGGAAREKWESLTALAALADDLFAMSPQSRIADLVRELDERAASQHAPTVEASPWPRCTLPRAWSGDRPPGRLLRRAVADLDGGDPEAIEEERRLLYVGVTRARTELAPHLGAVTLGRWPWHSPTLPLPRARRSSPRGAAVAPPRPNGPAEPGPARRHRVRGVGRPADPAVPTSPPVPSARRVGAQPAPDA